MNRARQEYSRGGKTDAPTAQRVFWVVMEGAIAAVLIFGGGDGALGAIQAVSISAGLLHECRCALALVKFFHCKASAVTGGEVGAFQIFNGTQARQ